METSGVLYNSVLLRLRKVTATRQLKVDHSLTVKATKPKMQQNMQRQNKERLGQNLTENYKILYEIWRQRNPTCRMYMDTKKLMKQKNYINKHKNITQVEIEEIKREMQASQESQLAGREEEKLVHAVTIEEDEYKLNAVPTTAEETENQKQRDQINNLREKFKTRIIK
jgi:hypothetical protein